MNPLKKVLTIAGCGILLHANAQQEVKIHLPKDSVLAIARDAYIYAAPLVYTDATRLKLSSADNVFFHQRFFPDYTFRAVVAPNNDTNYSIAFLDLSSDPVIIETPDAKGRYFVIPFLDAWTNNFELIGKRTTGTKAQKLFVFGPNWKGKVPEGFRHIKSPTNLVWVIGRIQVNNKEDQKSVVSPLQDKIRLTTLAKWLVKDTSALPHVQKRYYSITKDQFKNGVAQGIKALPIEEFFNYTNALLEDNPPAAYDEKIVKRIAQINIGKGLKFSLSDFDEATKLALDSLTGNIYKELDSGGITANAEEEKRRSIILGNYGTDYYYRTLVAYYGLGALPPQEAIYIDLKSDAAKQQLNGNYNYVIHFDKGKLPPAKAFWSLTVYDKERYLSKNDINRYAIGDRDSLKYNADGSLDIYIGHQNPGAAKVSNWLPAPADQFYLIFRIYVPEENYVKNRSVWKNPQLQKIAE